MIYASEQEVVKARDAERQALRDLAKLRSSCTNQTLIAQFEEKVEMAKDLVKESELKFRERLKADLLKVQERIKLCKRKIDSAASLISIAAEEELDIHKTSLESIKKAAKNTLKLNIEEL